MDAYISLFIKAAFVENLALAFFLGMCTFLAISKRVDTAIGLGLAVVVVQFITVPVNYLIFEYLLADGALAWAGIPDVDLSFLGLALVLFAIGRVMRVPPHEGILSWAKLTPARRVAEFHLLDQRAARYERFTIPYQVLRIAIVDRGKQYRIEIAGFPRATIPVLFETYSRTEARRLAREAGEYLSIPLAA